MRAKLLSLTAASILLAQPVLAEGGEPRTTAIANPQATSSGSVQNNAVQVLQGPYITNQYGGGISCQGPTMNITPFLFGTSSGQTPFITHYDHDGDPHTDPIDSGQRDNWSLNPGISATISIPLDGGLQERCKAAADAWTQRMITEENKARLDLELVRLLRCGEAMKAGIMFHPDSPYAAICSDIVVHVPVAVEPSPPSDPSPAPSPPSSSPSPEDQTQTPSVVHSPSILVQATSSHEESIASLEVSVP